MNDKWHEPETTTSSPKKVAVEVYQHLAAGGEGEK
jgi:hypothetical protein